MANQLIIIYGTLWTVFFYPYRIRIETQIGLDSEWRFRDEIRTQLLHSQVFNELFVNHTTLAASFNCDSNIHSWALGYSHCFSSGYYHTMLWQFSLPRVVMCLTGYTGHTYCRWPTSHGAIIWWTCHSRHTMSSIKHWHCKNIWKPMDAGERVLWPKKLAATFPHAQQGSQC